MTRRDALGLDELMIVNPSAGGLSRVFVGADGRLYGVAAPTQPRRRGRRRACACGCAGCGQRTRAAPAMVAGLGGLLLAADGAVYEIDG